TAQPRQQVLELGELYLSLALAALRMLAEDVQDDGGAIDDLDAHNVLERTPLAGRQLRVGHNRVRSERGNQARKLLRLALAEVRARVGVRTALQQPVEHHGTRGLGESGELSQRIL